MRQQENQPQWLTCQTQTKVLVTLERGYPLSGNQRDLQHVKHPRVLESARLSTDVLRQFGNALSARLDTEPTKVINFGQDSTNHTYKATACNRGSHCRIQINTAAKVSPPQEKWVAQPLYYWHFFSASDDNISITDMDGDYLYLPSGGRSGIRTNKMKPYLACKSTDRRGSNGRSVPI